MSVYTDGFYMEFSGVCIWKKKIELIFLRQFRPTTEEKTILMSKLFVIFRMLPQSVCSSLEFWHKKKNVFFFFLSFLSFSHFSLPEFPFCPRVAQYVVNKIGLDSILCHHTDVNEEAKKKDVLLLLFLFLCAFAFSLFSSEKQWLLCTDWINPCLSYLNVKQNTKSNNFLWFLLMLAEIDRETKWENTHSVLFVATVCIYE